MARYETQGKYLPILHEATQRAITALLLNACWNQIKQELSYWLSFSLM